MHSARASAKRSRILVKFAGPSMNFATLRELEPAALETETAIGGTQHPGTI